MTENYMRYRVSMQERVFYSVYVDATDEDAACAAAEAAFIAGDYKTDGVDDRSITSVEKIEPKPKLDFVNCRGE